MLPEAELENFCMSGHFRNSPSPDAVSIDKFLSSILENSCDSRFGTATLEQWFPNFFAPQTPEQNFFSADPHGFFSVNLPLSSSNLRRRSPFPGGSSKNSHSSASYSFCESFILAGPAIESPLRGEIEYPNENRASPESVSHDRS